LAKILGGSFKFFGKGGNPPKTCLDKTLHCATLLPLGLGVHTSDKDKTRLSCLVRVGGVNTIEDKTRQFCFVSTQFPISKFSVVLNIFETEQLQIGNWVETRQNWLVLSPILFTPPTRTRQDKTRQFRFVRVSGVNELLG